MLVDGQSDATSALKRFPVLLTGMDLSCFCERELAALLSEVRAMQRCLDGLVMRIGVRSQQMASDGASVPVADLMRGAGAVGARQASLEAERVRAASEIEGLSEAASAGKTTGAHVDSIARHTAKLDEEQRSSFDFVALVEKAGELPVETFDRFVKRQVEQARGDHGLRDAVAKRAASEFRHWFDQSTGMGRFSGSLDPVRYEAMTTAIDQRTSSLASRSGEPVTKNHNLAAEALVDLVTAGGERAAGAHSRLPYVSVVVDHDTIVHGAHGESVRQTENGHDIPPETVARLCCDAVIRRITLDQNGVPLNVGRKYRTATEAQWAALKSVYSSCAWSGCEAPINWCQAHHIREWESGGATDLDNLIPLCSRHHHQVHEGQWHIKLLPDRSLKIFRPDGAWHATVQPAARGRDQDGNPNLWRSDDLSTDRTAPLDRRRLRSR